LNHIILTFNQLRFQLAEAKKSCMLAANNRVYFLLKGKAP
jgi:hypothetical protein